MIKAHSRRSFFKTSAVALAGALVPFFTNVPALFAQSPYHGLRKTLRTPEWPKLNQTEKDLLSVPVSDEDAKKLLDYAINLRVYQNQQAKETMHGYQVKGKPIELKRDWRVNLVLNGIPGVEGFYDGVTKRAHKNNPGKQELTIGDFQDAFLDHCSFHVLKDGIRWLCVKAQGTELSDNALFHRKQAGLKNSIPLYEALMGEIESWPIFKNLTFDPQNTDPWDEDLVEKIANEMDRYDLLAIMKKVGIGTGLLKFPVDDLRALPKNEAAVRFLSARSISYQAAAHVP